MAAYSIRVSGNVQGVFYRHSAQQQAKLLGITGWVRNETDGSVYMQAEGNETALKQFVNWAGIGPPQAKVERIEAEPVSARGFDEFSIV